MRIWALLGLLLMPSSVVAQPAMMMRCRTLTLPPQGDNFNTSVTIPPSIIGDQLTYPVIYTVPDNAVSVGLMFWASRFQLGLPFDMVAIHAYTEYPDGTRSLDIPRQNMGTLDDYDWRPFPMSIVMHRGEKWVVGVYNGSGVMFPDHNGYNVKVDLITKIHECTSS